MKYQIRSNVINGNLKRNRDHIKQAIASFEGKEVIISIDKAKKNRSNNQNSYYWGVCIPLIQSGLKEATGEYFGIDNIHYDILLKMFAPSLEVVNKSTGQILSRQISSSDMTTIQFMEYVMEVQKWASEFLNINIPDPNEEILISFDND
jgi:hypothetical protein